MANIKILKENELVGGTDNTPVYPVSSTQAIYCQDSSGNMPSGVKPRLEDRLKDIENSMEAQGYVTLNEKTIHVGNKSITVPDKVSQLANDLGYLSLTSGSKLSSDLVDDTNNTNKFVTAAEKTAWNAKSTFSGSYNDLTNKPTIPAAQIQADWNQSSTSSLDYIKNKPNVVTSTTSGLKIEVVAALPASPDSNTIYIVQ